MKGPPRNRAAVQYRTAASLGAKGEIVREDHGVIPQFTDVVEPGDSRVTVGLEIKNWASNSTGGLTVGGTVEVSLSCKQDNDSLGVANAAATELAYQFLKRNIQRMENDLERYVDATQAQEPDRWR